MPLPTKQPDTSQVGERPIAKEGITTICIRIRRRWKEIADSIGRAAGEVPTISKGFSVSTVSPKKRHGSVLGFV